MTEELSAELRLFLDGVLKFTLCNVKHITKKKASTCKNSRLRFQSSNLQNERCYYSYTQYGNQKLALFCCFGFLL